MKGGSYDMEEAVLFQRLLELDPYEQVGEKYQIGRAHV